MPSHAKPADLARKIAATKRLAADIARDLDLRKKPPAPSVRKRGRSRNGRRASIPAPVRWRTPSSGVRPSGFVEPCLPKLANAVPNRPLWVHEIKHDGYRFICRRDGGRVRLFTRRGHDWTGRLPHVAAALLSLPVVSVTLDGEVVICGRDSIADFDQLRAAKARRRIPIRV